MYICAYIFKDHVKKDNERRRAVCDGLMTVQQYSLSSLPAVSPCGQSILLRPFEFERGHVACFRQWNARGWSIS